MASLKIALAGNPNSGKTTLFNALTGSNQFVGNWPGVTVEKKEGKLKTDKGVTVVDLPGIYSLSPYTLEEVIARNYLISERPNAILNIVDGANLERNLYLTTQLTELGIPVVVAVNMMDVVRKNGDKIDTVRLARELGCRVVEISALKATGIEAAAQAAIEAANGAITVPQHSFSAGVEHTLAHIEEALLHDLPDEQQRWYAIKLFERDAKITERLGISAEQRAHIDKDIKKRETELEDDSESIITAERYSYIDSIIRDCLKIKNKGKLSLSDKIDKIVTNRFLALPIFAVVMFCVYFVSVTTVGTLVTDWTNDGAFGDGWHLTGGASYSAAVEEYEVRAAEAEEQGVEFTAEEPDPASYGVWVPGIPVLAEKGLDAIHTNATLKSLLLNGVIAGVGAVLGFVPQMLVLFIFLAILEACGYMARIAFILDRVFRRFGLSGKSFIPILIGTGCGVPGVMASRTIENERDRRMTIMTTTFIPCGAKLPIIAMIAGALFGGAWWVAPSAYFIGMAAIICSGVMLKKTKLFAGDVAPFVMELPAYHLPTASGVLRSMWERGWSFIKRAGTIVLLSTIFVWFTSGYGFTDGRFGAVEDMNDSLIAMIGSAIAFLFKPLGWGVWQASTATFLGLVAKEVVVSTLGVLYGIGEVAEDDAGLWANLQAGFSAAAGFSFLVFNLLCAPCFAAIGAIRREMNNRKWFWFAIGYQTLLAYVVSLVVYQISLLLSGGFSWWLIPAALLLGLLVFLIVRPTKKKNLLKAK
ncbi:MAG: ferrous iron transporter B [Oscillospiraceae bacterium]|jgi:ferrous iron transport protein B|nr:ferrous iron transporter B [Oscillospiraceae bacterium]